jgi:hypothetical protein
MFFLVPIFLPLFNWGFQPSLSEFHYTSQKWTYIISMGIIALLMALDGSLNITRRYNILIGLSMIGVLLFPVNEFINIHNSFAIMFFVGNAFIVTYYSKLLPRSKKVLFSLIISITLSLLILGKINIYVTELIGMWSMSYFMYIRYSILELRRKTFV